MRLLAAAWQQKRPAAAWLRRKGAVTKQPQVMFPFQDKRVVHVFLPGPAVLLSIPHGRYESWRGAARKERVRVVAVQPQYTAEQLSVEIRL